MDQMDQIGGGTPEPEAESKPQRGRREFAAGRHAAGRLLPQLRARYPAAFPTEPALVRPLAGSAIRQIAADFGFPLKFVRGLLFNWKRSEAYCRAVLSHSVRITLDGAVDPGMDVDDQARRMARHQLERYERRRAARKAAEAAAPEPPPAAPTPVAPVRRKLTLKAPPAADAVAHTTTRTVRTIEVPGARGRSGRR